MAGVTGLGATTEIGLDGPPRSNVERYLRWSWRAGVGVLVLLTLVLAWLVAVGGLFKSGDDVGYNLGLVGGVLMLSLLLYPLRKRVRFMGRLGAMRQWFRYHMVAGIGGPVLVLFHSTFKTGSMNGRVALYAMLLVMISGIVGRFVYRHIHRGLYGRKMTIADAEQELKASREGMRSLLVLVPSLETRLAAFHELAFAEVQGLGARIWRFVTLRWRGHRVVHSVRREAGRALKRAMRERQWSRAEARLHWQLSKAQVNAYVDAVCQAAQFSIWEKLFSLWHVIHVPFLYLLVFSGIVHVIAVHMY